MSPRHLPALVLTGLLALGAGGCGADEKPAPPAAARSAAPIAPAAALARIAEGATVLDVRTPAEFDAGHLDGARNIDVQADDFVDRVGELPRDAAYVVYCASGRRATGAVAQMVDLGFTDVVNGGGYEDLAAG